MIELLDTNSSGIAAELVRARKRTGSPAMGMVMTLVIVVDEDEATAAMDAARLASHEHPARVIGVILGDGRGAGVVNAQVGMGDGWTGEIALIRLKGEVVKHAESVVLPLLLPDSPVAIWWPHDAPADPAADPLGALAQRRITDAASVSSGRTTALSTQCSSYVKGNTDLAWTRITPWRALLAAALDQHPLKVTGGSVTAERDQPERRPAHHLAGEPAQGADHPAQLGRSRDHRGGARERRGPGEDHPHRRRARHVHHPGEP